VTEHPLDENSDLGKPIDDAPSAGEAADAALDAVEPERLLPGEDEGSVHLDDAEHWTNVYSELLDFKRSLLKLAEDRIGSMHKAARTEVEDTDLKILQAEALRLARRFEFWRARKDVLTDRAT
jgi:hypothetical protein